MGHVGVGNERGASLLPPGAQWQRQGPQPVLVEQQQWEKSSVALREHKLIVAVRKAVTFLTEPVMEMDYSWEREVTRGSATAI